MGISWSSRRRNNYFQNPPPVPPPLPPPPPPYYSTEPLPPPPPPMPPAPGSTYVFASATSSSYHAPPNSLYAPPNPPPHYFSGPYGQCNHPNAMMGRYNYQPYYANQPNWWTPIRPPMGQLPLPPQAPPPPFVEHQNAKKVKNDVNVHKDTLRVEVDEQNPDQHLLSFVFDALYDGSITIIYFAKEESNCKFVPQFPDAFVPLTISFQKGSGQKFCQPSGTGIDFGFFELDDLSKASPKEDVFPLVICAVTHPPPDSDDRHVSDSMQDASSNMQITQAVLEKRNTESFQVKVIRQILWVDGIRYELRDIFGIANSSVEGFKDTDGKECVICMTEPKDTFVLPCRHMCMCSDCAKELRLQTNKCPICRQPIEELVGIKINNNDQ